MPSVFGRKLKREEKLYLGCMFSFNVGTLVTIYCVFQTKKKKKGASVPVSVSLGLVKMVLCYIKIAFRAAQVLYIRSGGKPVSSLE